MSHFDVQGINKGSASRVEEHIREDNRLFKIISRTDVIIGG